MITDKKQLVEACKQRDQQAMKQLYDELAPSMLGVCMRYTHSRDEAQDLLHDGFIRVYENIGMLKNAESLESWVYHIMVSVSVDYLKSNSKVVYCDTDKLDWIAAEDEEEELDLDRINSRAEDIVEALQSLPEHYRVVFNMRAVEEMEYDKIAVLLKYSESTVRNYLVRAIELIKKKLNTKGIDNE